MKHSSSRIFIACLAAALVLADGCSRSEPERPAPRQRRPERRLVQANRPPKRMIPPPAELGPMPAVLDDPPVLEAPSPTPANIADSSSPTTHEPKPGGKKAEVDALFAQPTLLRIDVEIPQAGMRMLRRTQWGNGQQRPVAKVTIREGGTVYTNVALHLKGSAGSFRSVDDNPALTLNFAKYAPEQSFHGLHKISLNNSVQDPTFLCEQIAREIFIEAGVPTPRASHSLVRLNGRDLGLYVLLEGANKQFLKRYFNNASGNLYDGGFCREIGSGLAVNSGDNPNDHSGLQALISVMRTRPTSFDRLARVLDVDRFVSMMAVEMMLCHWDGYTLNRNNWRIFHDVDANKMVFIPHGLDQLFGFGRPFNPGSPLIPQHVSGEVSRALLSMPEGRRRYLQRVAQLYTNVFNTDRIVGRIDEIVAGLVPELARSNPQLARSFQAQAHNLKQRIIRRGEGLSRQLGPPPPPVQFTSEGVLKLTGWKASLVRSGEPVLSQARGPTGNTLLGINAGQSISSSSWRTEVALGPGRYQFEGRLLLKGVTIDAGDSRGGAGLRISKGNMPRKLTGTSDWTDYRYPFTVQDETSDVELVCELRATRGEAWFDTATLKLVRLP